MKRKISIITAFALIMFLMVSCSVSSKIGKDISENAKNQNPPQGKSLVYVYRTSVVGFAVGFHVSLNNRMLDNFFPKSFYLCTLDPGKYVFTGHGENEDDIVLTTEPNKKYYIEVRPKMGYISPRVQLELHDQVDGNKGVQKCKMIGSTSDATPITNQIVNPKQIK